MIDNNGLAIPEDKEPINDVKREALTSKIAGFQNIADEPNISSKYSALVNDLLRLIPSCYYHAASEHGNEAITEQLRLMAKDAARYRFLKEATNRDWCISKDAPGGGKYQYMAKNLDAVIDAAIESQRSGDGS